MMEEDESSSSLWSREEEKLFENAVATYFNEDGDEKWEKIAAELPGKTVEDIKEHYDLLVEDLGSIESGQIPLPCYTSSSEGGDEGSSGKKGGGDSGQGGKSAKSDQERRKGIAWTEEEHRLFLLGLEKYGKGDWRSISRNFVISRTPTQVASHAQKYFIRLNSMNKDRRRTSIHDITSVDNVDAGHANGPSGTAGTSSKQSSQPSAVSPGIGVYGTTIGQPVGGPLISALGTPVNLPVSVAPAMIYGMQAPVPGTVVPGAPVAIQPMAHPMPPPNNR